MFIIMPSNKVKRQASRSISDHHNLQSLQNVQYPSCQVRTLVKLCPTFEKLPQLHPSRNIQLYANDTSRLTFHSFEKYSSTQFIFDRIFDHNSSHNQVQQEINLYQQLIQKDRDFCLLAVGNNRSGLLELCQSDENNQAQLWDKISAIMQKNSKEKCNIKQIQLSLKLMAVSNEKLYDMQELKGQPILRQNNQESYIQNCKNYTVTSIYDLYRKMKEVNENKRVVFPQSIQVIEGNLTFRKTNDPEAIHNRNFRLIGWQKNLAKSEKTKQNNHNNQSLLNLNMCLYQLYKITCHQQQFITKDRLRKLWAHFRNSVLTKLIKNFFIKGNRLVTLGCVSLQQLEQKQNLHTLMLLKNIKRIKFKSNEKNNNHTIKIQPVTLQVSRKVSLSSQKVSLQRNSIDNSKFKKQFVSAQLKTPNIQNHKYLQRYAQATESISYELKNIKQKSKRPLILKNKAHNTQNSNTSSTYLPSIQRNSQLKLKTQQKHQKNAFSQPVTSQKKDLQLSRNDIIQIINQQQQEMHNYVSRKKKTLQILRKQLQQFKKHEEKHQPEIINRMFNKNQPDQKYQQKIIKKTDKNIEQPSDTIQESPYLSRLRTINKGNYLFQKKRMRLKSKISKGRPQVNAFYQQMAQQYQKYKLSSFK